MLDMFRCVPNRFFSREIFILIVLKVFLLETISRPLDHTCKDQTRSHLSLLCAQRPPDDFMKIHFQFASVIALRRLPLFTFPSARSDCSWKLRSIFGLHGRGNRTTVNFVTVEIERNRCDGREQLFQFLAEKVRIKTKLLWKEWKIFRDTSVSGKF